MNYAVPAWDASRPFRSPAPDRYFPVRHVYCVGRNYAEHAKEMGGDATKEPPFFFTKPADAVAPVVAAPRSGTVHYPLATKNYHHEIELVVAIGKRGVQLPRPSAQRASSSATRPSLDMTAATCRATCARRNGRGTLGKSFAQAAPIAPIHRCGGDWLARRAAQSRWT